MSKLIGTTSGKQNNISVKDTHVTMNNHHEMRLYIFLSSLLCVIFVTSNLICKKFVSINIFNWTHFEVSVGVLFFPITFLITDMLTEFYGKNLAKKAVTYCLMTGGIIIFLIFIATSLNATAWSPVSNSTFSQVFDIYNISVAASFITFYISQIFDIHIFSHIRKITGDKHLWLRNNLSSFISQFIDTILIIGILTVFEVIPYHKFLLVVTSSYCFKLFAAILDTPFCYFAHSYIHSYLEEDSLEPTQALSNS